MKEIKSLKGLLSSLREAPGRRGPSREEIKVQDRLSELYHREEIMWRQRSGIEWLKEGVEIPSTFNRKLQ